MSASNILAVPSSLSECHDEIQNQLDLLVNHSHTIKNVYIATKSHSAPDLAWQIDIPRFDIVLSGSIVTEYSVSDSHHVQQQLNCGDVLYIPASAWSQPVWQQEVTLLSLMISNHKIGFSLQKWNGQSFDEIAKRPTIRQHQKIGNGLLQALNELSQQESDQHTSALVIRSLLSHIMTMSELPECLPTRQEELFHKIVRFIDQHYSESLTREMLAEQFYISPNYLSHIFQQQGNTSFKEYVCEQRLEKAQTLLREGNSRIKQISEQCGFADSNYFCRLFKQKLGLTPSQFRASSSPA
ncbi:AraC family transcriptional regulator [Photobacterium sp. SDRW27]|uniref:AraC family transcriptional regulator n=1 Tax=Photobacterium obscurum TaxID=2829490 RepID=UPI0022432CB9|nr:AraC family transcriptional regulator [Photobacterium obscurum]MCW8329213.1 AraC family transcriptional regulator [Photobacterium obscurum]